MTSPPDYAYLAIPLFLVTLVFLWCLAADNWFFAYGALVWVAGYVLGFAILPLFYWGGLLCR